ncbi:serine/arginine-rich splicing factor 5-like [Toxorhynchites rutilus septentrionalis]|uniref:serine/arginine-rich splicing factor 5-like n=1 Tax=Toxorhynchites rutilus septentrionalis TaxID=329112 RepID=UPI0024790195|nr:serine/arginine-rich splicing factor 5-like [Toxorhynchites rutilus septentrionalis]
MVGSRVYVGGLARDARERDLEKFFKGYGRLCDVMIKNGFGFVEFEDHRDADDAVYELNGKDLLGGRVTVEHAKGKPRRGEGRRGGGRSEDHRSGTRYGPPRRSKYRLTVENLSSKVSWQDLKDYLRRAGEVIYADAHRPRRNEGVVEFESRRDMEAAIDKLDDTDLSGRRIRLVEDCVGQSKRGRSRSLDSRSRSRSPRRSRSRSSRYSRSHSDSRDKSVSPRKPRHRNERQKRYRDESRSRSRSTESRGKKICSRSRSKSERRSRHRSVCRDNKSRSSVRLHETKDKSPTPRAESPEKRSHRSRSRSSKREAESSSRDRKQHNGDMQRSRSRSKSERRSKSRSKSKDNKCVSHSDSYSSFCSQSSHSNSGSRTRSVSRDYNDRSFSQDRRSASPEAEDQSAVDTEVQSTT